MVVLAVRRGGAAAFVMRGGGVPGRPTDYFFFLAEMIMSAFTTKYGRLWNITQHLRHTRTIRKILKLLAGVWRR